MEQCGQVQRGWPVKSVTCHFPGGDAVCTCGQTGCVETVASKVGIQRSLRAAIERGVTTVIDPDEKLRSSVLKKAWHDGDPAVREAIDKAVEGISWAVVNLTLVVDPEVFLLGGGVFEELGEQLIPAILDGVATQPYASLGGPPTLRVATLGDLAVATGAAVAGAAIR